jgi:plastocyanin
MARTIRRSLARGLIVGAPGALSLAIALAPAALAADHAVDIAGFAFSPQSITVAVGDTITWSNSDAQNHTATADDGSFDTGTVSSGSPKSVTFSTAGTFAYHCRIHPAMTATVVVEDAATAPATDTAPVAGDAPGGSSGPVWIVLVIGAIGGGLLARRRFGRASARP